MRYFFFSYTAQSSDGIVNGNIYMAADRFVPNKNVKEEIVKMQPKVKPESVIIMSIFEFDKEVDFVDFSQK